MTRIIHKIKGDHEVKNLCDGTTKGDYNADWKKVTCKRCLRKRP